jgi:hypothetical protein
MYAWEAKMDFDKKSSRVIDRLHRALPIRSYPRQALLDYLSAIGVSGRGAPCLSVIDVFDGGTVHGVMCRVSVLGGQSTRTFVVPIGQISFDRNHPLARAITNPVVARVQRPLKQAVLRNTLAPADRVAPAPNRV